MRMPDSQYDDEEDYESVDDFDDDVFDTGAPKTNQFAASAAPTANSNPRFRSRVRADLTLAKSAGFKIGHHGGLLDGLSCYVSVSCRIGKLGVSEEAMRAWEITRDDYLILVTYYPSGYKSLSDLKSMDNVHQRRCVQFSVGISDSYKPTLAEAIKAFNTVSVQDQTKGDAYKASQGQTAGRGFRSCFISRPLNQLFNERVLQLMLYREVGMSWLGAEQFYNDHQGMQYALSDALEDRYMEPEEPCTVFPPIVTQDHLSATTSLGEASFPLAAMQVLLRHFVRCTEFCLVCHRKLPDDLEAIKPYVCENPLCLYQYMSLGFGPSIEHEIVTQPNVVDLLISFCYFGATVGKKLKTYPTGLGLLVPPVGAVSPITTTQDPYSYYGAPSAPSNNAPIPKDQAHKTKFNRSGRELLFEAGVKCPFRVGDWIVIQKSPKLENDLHCRITSTTYFPTVSVSEPITFAHPTDRETAVEKKLEEKLDQSKSKGKPQTPAVTPSFEPAEFYIYNCNFDEIGDQWKSQIILQLLCSLPSVQDMQEYINRTGKELSTWVDRVSPAAAAVLRWIIASSRACIFQVDDIDGNQKASTSESRVFGMTGWMQFRFAMGAPDKERRFIQEVNNKTDQLKLKYPTIFAWHGSTLANWHCIVREGLRYDYVQSGRAFGDGVYMAQDVHTSLGYSTHFAYRGGNTATGWPQSRLNITCAISLQEVVNAPNEFRSSNPHFVVQHIDWIQTRYLFIKCNNADVSGKLDDVQRPIGDAFEQDPARTVSGESGKIIIPASAVSRSRRDKSTSVLLGKKGIASSIIKKFKASGSAIDPILVDIDDGASITTEVGDLEIFMEDAVPEPPPPPKTVAKSSKSMTDFVPGSLDVASLPILAPPAYATPAASKRLLFDFKSLVKVQESTPLHELGWYVNPDPDLMTNLFQWIVELHSFEPTLPLAQDMKKQKITSVVLEMRFGKDFPHSPPFVRIIRPRFLGGGEGGGGHVTIGGAICIELLTNSGWSAVSSIESVLLQIRMAMSSTDPRPARLAPGRQGVMQGDYSIFEAVDAYRRACMSHGWAIPQDLMETTKESSSKGELGY